MKLDVGDGRDGHTSRNVVTIAKTRHHERQSARRSANTNASTNAGELW